MKESNTPGALLKAAREEHGFSVVDVAVRLCLSVQFIEDMENDDYSHMSARAYARGYVMSYAHLLGIPEDQILPALGNVRMEFAPSKNTIAVDNENALPIYQPTESSQQRPSFLLWGSIIVLIILIGLVIMWWKGPSAPSVKGSDAAATSTAISIEPESAAKPAPAVAPAVKAPAPVAAPAPVPAPAPVTPPQPSAVSPSPLVVPAPGANDSANPPQSQSANDPMQPSEVSAQPVRSARPAAPVAALPPPRASTDD